MNSLPEAASDAEKEKEKLRITGVAFVFAGHWPNGAQLVVYQEKGHRLLATMSLDCCVDHVQAQRAQIMDKHYDAERQISMKAGRAGAKAKGQHTSFLFPVGSHKSQVLKS